MYKNTDKKYIEKTILHTTRFVAKIYLWSKPVEHKSFSKHKKTGLFYYYYYYYFGLPFRQMNATCKLVATENDSVLHKIMFRRSLQRSGWRDYEWTL